MSVKEKLYSIIFLMDINSLHSFHIERRKNRQEQYLKILQRCWNRIKFISSVHPSATSCWFQIPEFVIGIPPHDMTECSNFVYNNLVKDGFIVKRYNNHIFNIS